MSAIAKKLQQVILRDCGLEVTEPVTINRGYWRDIFVFRWECREIKSPYRHIYCMHPMKDCVWTGLQRELHYSDRTHFYEFDPIKEKELELRRKKFPNSKKNC